MGSVQKHWPVRREHCKKVVIVSAINWRALSLHISRRLNNNESQRLPEV